MIPDIWIFVDNTADSTSTFICTNRNLTEATDWVQQQERQRRAREAQRRREDQTVFIQTYRNPPAPEPYFEPPRILPWWFFDRGLQRQNPRVMAGHPRRIRAEARRDCLGRTQRRPARVGRPSSWKTLKRRIERGTLHKEKRTT